MSKFGDLWTSGDLTSD